MRALWVFLDYKLSAFYQHCLTIDRLILFIVFNGHGDNWGLCFKHKLLEQTSLVSGVFEMLVDHKVK